MDDNDDYDDDDEYDNDDEDDNGNINYCIKNARKGSRLPVVQLPYYGARIT